LTECGNLSEVEETETAAVVVKMAEAIETVVAAVMTMAKTAAVVVTDKKGDDRQYIRGNAGA
jgi:hypothetical protein